MNDNQFPEALPVNQEDAQRVAEEQPAHQA